MARSKEAKEAIDFEADAKDANERVAAPDESLLKMIQSAIEQEAAIERLQEEIKVKSKKLTDLLEKDLPEAMASKNVQTLILKDGTKVEVEKKIFASIPAEKKDDAHEWLVANKHGDLIKTLVTIAFAKGDHAKAVEAIAKLKALKYEPVITEAVNAQTLKAFAKEQMEKGVDLPEKCFSVYQKKVAEIKLGKKQ